MSDNVKEDVGSEYMLAILASLYAHAQTKKKFKDLDLYTHYNEISITVRLEPEEGGIQSIFKAKQNERRKWKLKVHDYLVKEFQKTLKEVGVP